MCKFSNRIFVCYMFTLSLCPSVIFFSLLGERCQGAGAQGVYDTCIALFQGLPRFYFSIHAIHGSGRGEKQGRPENTYHMMWHEWGRCRGGGGCMTTNTFWSDSEFLADQTEYLQANMLFECGPLPPMSASHSPDVIHMIKCLPASIYLCSVFMYKHIWVVQVKFKY